MNTNCNSNRRAFVTTLVVLVVCLVIVTGSTFSLFTSKSGTNIAITSGKVEMVATIDAGSLKLYSKDAEQQTGKFENGGTAGFNAKNTELTLTNVTPGDKVTFEIDVVNNSNVDIQYRVNWVVDGELAEALVASVDGVALAGGTSEWVKWIPSDPEKKTLAVAIELPLDAGNSYQNKTANIAFNVEAVQANATGEYSSVAYISTPAGLQAAIDAGCTEIILNNDLELTETLVIPTAPATYSLKSTAKVVALDLNGKTITAAASIADSDNCVLIMNRGNLVITNGTINVENATAIRNHGATANLVLENMTVTQTGSDVSNEWLASAVFTSGGATTVIKNGTYTGVSSAVIVATSGGNLTINGGTFTAEKTAARVDSWNYESVLTINDGTFNSADKALFADGNKYVTVNGGTFNATIDSTYTNIDIKGGTFNVSIMQPGGHQNRYNISGGTFVDDPSNQNGKNFVAAGYSAVNNLDGTYTVMPEGFEFVASGLYKKDNAYHVYTVEGFKYLSAKAFTGNNGVAESVSIVLEADFDMNGAEFSAIIAQRGDTLTFVGNNHKISNIKLISGAKDNTTGQASLFYAFPGSTLNVSDLVIENVVVISDNDASGYAAVLVGYCEGTANITNVDVINASVTGAKSSGLVVGHLSGTLNVEDSTFAGTVTITDYEAKGHYAGKYVGTLAGEASIVDSTATATLGGKLHEKNVGEIYGRSVSGSLEVLTSYVENKVTYYRDEIKGDVLLYLVNSDYAESTLTIPEGVTTIGNYAFAYNNNVKTVVLASTVRELGRCFDSSNVEKVVLNEGLTTISARAFRSTPNLKEVVIPSTVTTIADNAFQKSGIKTITIPANVKTIGEAAFGASKIETVIFEGNTNIEGYAFRGCPNLTTVYLNGLDVNFVASTLNGRNSCWFCNGESNNPNTSNITFYVKTDVIKERVLTAMGAERNNTPVIVEMTPAAGGYYTDSEGNAYVYDSAALVAAINAAEATIYLSAGDYALGFTNHITFNVNNLTIKGLGEVKLAISSSETWYGRVQGSNVTFENIHFTSSVGATGKATYNNCIFDSWAICASSNNEETYFNNCVINGCLNTSTDFSSGDVYVKDCKIAKAEYSGSMTVNFKNCEIGEVIIWNSNTNFTNCEITTLNDDNVTTATVIIK